MTTVEPGTSCREAANSQSLPKVGCGGGFVRSRDPGSFGVTDRGESTALTSPSGIRLTQVRRNCTRASKAEITVPRSIAARTAYTLSAPVREETYNGQLHLVVPVIAILGNIVFWPSSAAGYEFVPDYVLSACPVGWNNRPVVLAHPSIGEPTANTPVFLAAQCFGQLFHTIYEPGRGNRDTTGKLKTEAWLNISRAAIVGQGALDVIDKCRAGEMVEVSVGAQIAFESRTGTYGGRDYVGIWRGLVPDHLAMGIAEGACDVETGCGGPRTATKSATTSSNNNNSNINSISNRKRSRIYLANGGSNMLPKGLPRIAFNKSQSSSLLDIAKSLVSAVRMSATPAEDAEEAAELIAYGSMRDLVSSAITKLQAAQAEISNLITTETTDPTTTDEDESAEETIEIARFQRIRTFLYSAGDDTYSASSIVYDLYNTHMRDKEIEEANTDGVTPVVIVGDTRYYAAGEAADGDSDSNSPRNAKGARHSKNDMKMIQSTHDMTAKLGATCNADADGSESTPKTAATGEPNVTTVKPCGCTTNANLFSKLTNRAGAT